MEIIPILLLGFIVYVVVKNFSFLRKLYLVIKTQKDFSKKFQEQQRSYSQQTKANNPEPSSVDKIREVNMDLNGGEYIDYEDIKEDKQ